MRISDWSSDVCSSDLSPSSRGTASRRRPIASSPRKTGCCAILRLPTALAMICCEAMMQRHDMIDTMRGLGLKGMAAAFDAAVTTGLQRKRTIMEILTYLLRAEATHRDATSIRYRMTADRLPVEYDLGRFRFTVNPTNTKILR